LTFDRLLELLAQPQQEQTIAETRKLHLQLQRKVDFVFWQAFLKKITMNKQNSITRREERGVDNMQAA